MYGCNGALGAAIVRCMRSKSAWSTLGVDVARSTAVHHSICVNPADAMFPSKTVSIVCPLYTFQRRVPVHAVHFELKCTYKLQFELKRTCQQTQAPAVQRALEVALVDHADKKLDAIICVSGGFAMGDAAVVFPPCPSVRDGPLA